MLEVRVTELHRQLEAERAELLNVKTIQDTTGKRINTAEAWGRAVIWTTIALGGVATQFTEIVTWFKR